MSGTYQVWLDDAQGNRITDLGSMLGMSIVKGIQSSAWSIALPGDFERGMVSKDNLVEIWRKPDTSLQPQLILVGMLKTIRQEENSSGIRNLIIGGPDGRALLGSRIVAYAAGSAEATKTDEADDMMKAIVHQNLYTAAGSGRDLSALGISVAAYLAQGPVISKAFGWKNVLTVLNDISAAAAQAGTEVYFDMHPMLLSSGGIGFEFITAINQPGIDRTADVFFGTTWGNLSDPVLVEDYTDEASYVYAGGRGLEISDTERVGSSVWGRKEIFLDTKSETDTTIMTGLANEELTLRRGKKSFSARLVDTAACRFGVEWNYGDRVTCQAFGQEFTGMIRTLQITVGNSGENVEAKIELDTA